MGEAHGEQDETVAMVLGHLCWLPSGTQLPDTPLGRPSAQEAAVAWQELGHRAQWAELHGAKAGTPEGRMSELMGRAAVTGEQLGLAWTLDQELQRWLGPNAEKPAGWTMAARALAELCGYYLLAAGNGLGNLTVRTLLLSSPAAGFLNRWRRTAKGFPPFSVDREAWPALTPRLAEVSMHAARASGANAAVALAEILIELTADPAWMAQVERRDTDYHRWRPQGLPSGSVPQRSLWDRPSPGTRSLSWGGPFYEPVDHELLCRTAGEALDVLSRTMTAWLEVWPSALTALGVPVIKTEG